MENSCNFDFGKIMFLFCNSGMNKIGYRFGILLPIIAFFLAAMVSCGTANKNARGHNAYNSTSSGKTKLQPPRNIEINKSLPAPTRALLSEADTWIGTPYAYGGNVRNKGVDCSGLVHEVYRNALGIKLPRNSAKQQQFCKNIRKQDLHEGDLIFFTVNGGCSVGHVGMYIGNGYMVHASSSKGVIVSSLDETYYVRNYHSSGRVEQYYALLDIKTESELPIRVNPATPLSANEKIAYQAVDGKSLPPVTRKAMQKGKTEIQNEILDNKADSIFMSGYFE